MLPVTASLEPTVHGRRDVHTVHLRRGTTTLTWSDFAAGLANDPQLRDAFSHALANAPLDAFFWECVPVSRDTRDQPFHSVLLDAPTLAGAPADTVSFADKLQGTAAPQVRTFLNLGKDAWLVVPAPADQPNSHVHLASFLRSASKAQIHRLWQDTGEALARWLAESAAPVWLSTCGTGVFWLHVRLDRHPKYISHAPFRARPF